MLRRKLQTIQLTLADLKEYEAVRRRLRQKAAIDALRATSVTTVTATETEAGPSAPPSVAPSTTTSDSSSETAATQRQLQRELANRPGWTQATVTTTDSTTNSGSTDDNASVQAVMDESDTIAELSDDGWEDIEEEEGAVGGEL